MIVKVTTGFLCKMRNFLLKVGQAVLLCLILHTTNAYATTFSLDFSSAKNYVDSLNELRTQISTPLPNLQMQGAAVSILHRPAPDSVLRINLDGIDPDVRQGELQLILHPESLYLVGFVNRRTNTFYRFSDFASISLPDVTSTVPLNADSGYTTLQRIANTNRIGMAINRFSLTGSYVDLRDFSGNALTQNAARALLRLITVSSEAIRFRQIARNFRPFLDSFSTNSYVMSQEDVDITLNWARLSSTLPDYRSGETVRVGRLAFADTRAVLAAVAVILNCRSSHSVTKRDLDAITATPEEQMPCAHTRTSIRQGNTRWDGTTIAAIQSALFKAP